MRLIKVKICRFRSFGDEEQVIYLNKLTTLIGNNSSGKTSSLQALLKIFADNSNERNLLKSDFFLSNEKKPEDVTEQNLYIEAVFDFPEVEQDNEEGEYSIPFFFEHFVVEEPDGIPYLRIRLEASWRKGNSIDGSIESRISYITCPEDEEIKDENRKSANRHDLNNIRMIYVPATRDPSKQLRNVSGTMLYRIMESINWSEKTKNSVEDKINELNIAFEQEAGVSIVKNVIRDQWKEYDSDHRYTNAEMRFNSTDMDSILKKSDIVFSPTVTGRECNIDEMGDGLRSLFYISMVDSMLEVENEIKKEIESETELKSFKLIPPILTLVAVEEPENHISPHLLGKLVTKLKNISERENAQTLIASHSPSIIRRIDPEDIRYLKVSEKDLSTRVKSLSFPSRERYEDKYKYIKEAVQAHPEIYFAKLVVLGEGDSEEIVLPKLIELCGGNIDSSGISIVPLGGRFVNHIWRLLNDLDIAYITLLDLDSERFGGGWGRVKYVLQQLLEIGHDRNILLNTKDGVLKKKEFDNMQNWKLIKNGRDLKSWIEFLEGYDVFFSSPLDLDFMMLECFEDNYKSILNNNEGPFIKDIGKIIDIEVTDHQNPNYKKRIKNDIHCTLKENGGTGHTYTEKQKSLMVWYNYFFLNRGKPSTHYLALSKIDEKLLKDLSPVVLKRMVKRINEKLNVL